MQVVNPLEIEEIEGGNCELVRGQSVSLPLKVALLTGGSDRPYTFGLTTALAAAGIHLEVVGSDAVDGPEMHSIPEIEFFNLRGDQRPDASLPRKINRLLVYYARLIKFAWTSNAKVFHVLWNNKFQYFDRTLLMCFYKLRGKVLVLTAHNVNEERRDGRDSLLNRFTLRIQYRLTNQIFVHTEKMKSELVKNYGVCERSVTVIPFGINNAVPHTRLTSGEARERLGIGESEKVILFFGRMRPSKGFEYLLAAFERIVTRDGKYRLIVAGQRNREFAEYWKGLRPTVDSLLDRGLLILRDEFIPDEDTELYFKAADVLVLPYAEIFQSGVLFLGYSFGLPVIATKVGSFKEDIAEGTTGFLCRPRDPVDLAGTIRKYFESDLFCNLDRRRQEIKDYANVKHSWSVVAGITREAYEELSREGAAWTR